MLKCFVCKREYVMIEKPPEDEMRWFAGRMWCAQNRGCCSSFCEVERTARIISAPLIHRGLIGR